jgi:hypothetical protein
MGVSVEGEDASNGIILSSLTIKKIGQLIKKSREK